MLENLTRRANGRPPRAGPILSTLPPRTARGSRTQIRRIPRKLSNREEKIKWLNVVESEGAGRPSKPKAELGPFKSAKEFLLAVVNSNDLAVADRIELRRFYWRLSAAGSSTAGGRKFQSANR